MKKLILAGAVGALSTIAGANTPLAIQSGQPVPIYQSEQSTPYVYAQPNSASSAPTASLSLEYLSHKAEFDGDIDADLDGFAIGLSTTPQRNGLWTKFEFLSNSNFDTDYYEFSFGGHLNLLSTERFYTIGTLGIGIGLIDVPGFDETAYFTIPVGLEAGVNLTRNLSLFGGVGYKWNAEISGSEDSSGGGRTLCKDGTWSNSTGRGTCSHHGGIADYQPPIEYDNYVGSFNGMTYKAGLRYNF